MMMNKDQIKEIIPHREPFLLLDEVIELEVGQRCKARWRLTGNEDFFRGHFPQHAVLPGVLIIESLAQAGAVAVLAMPENKGKIAFFASIKEAKFKRQVVPGDELVLETTMTKIRGRSGLGVGVATVGSEIACEAEIMFMFGSA